MKADHFEQQKLLDLAAEDVALTQLAHRRRTLPEVAAVEAAEEAERTFSADVVRAETEVRDLGREVKRLESDVETVRQREAKDQRLLDSGSVSPKELTNLQHELESLKRRQSDLEDQELELMERLEVAEAALAAAQAGAGEGAGGPRARRAAARRRPRRHRRRHARGTRRPAARWPAGSPRRC